MHKGDTIPGILVTLFGAIFFVGTVTNSELSFGSVTSDGVPGAGFFPYLLSIAVMLMGITLAIRGIRQRGTAEYIKTEKETKKNLKILALTMIGLLVFLAIWQFIGQFFIGMFLYILYLNRVLERTWKYTIMYAVIFTAFVYLVFSFGFSIQF